MTSEPQPTSACPPVTRYHLGVDMKDSTWRSNAAKGRGREAMYGFFRQALTTAGITQRRREALIDRGDGIIALIRPMDEVPNTLLLDTVVPTMVSSLIGYNAAHQDEPLRLRAVINSGLVHNDGDGWYGTSLDLTCRLLDSARLKQMFRQTSAPLVLVVPEDVYRSVVQQGYPGIDPRAFKFVVRVQIAGRRYRGHVAVPGGLTTARPA